MKIIVIGGGASGLMAAILAKTPNNEVTIIESNSDIAKKILVTGNGRCNYWHENIDTTSYHTDEENNLKEILNKQNEVFKQLVSFGLVPKNKDGYFYPLSNQASSIRDMFKYQLLKKEIKIVNDFKLIDIQKIENTFLIKSKKETLECDKVIIATGSNAGLKEENSTIHNILRGLGHTINPILPSLVPLIVEGAKKYNWAGIRTEAELSLISDYKVIKEERGELQLTNDGISGIVTFNISGYASRELSKHNDVSVQINFLPDIKDVRTYLNERAKLMGNVSMNELLNSLLNYKLTGLLLHLSHIDGTTTYNNLKENQLKWLINNITSFECNILDTEDFSRAQVCTGGISLSEINPDTMESTIIPNMHIIGELLDVDGICGGYNLAFAFITGYLAGKCLSCSE